MSDLQRATVKDYLQVQFEDLDSPTIAKIATVRSGFGTRSVVKEGLTTEVRRGSDAS